MKVRAVMERNVRFAGTHTSLADVARMMGEHDCGALPILDREKVVGMITDRDVCLAMADARQLPSEISAAQVMSRNVHCCGPDEDLVDALATMQNKRVRRLPVVDDDGKLRGILSMDDVVLFAEASKPEGRPRLGYGDAVNTLKAIYKRPTSRETLVMQPSGALRPSASAFLRRGEEERGLPPRMR